MLFSIRSLKHAKQKEILDQGPSFPYEVVGSPIIDENYNVSGFSTSDYVKIGSIPAFDGDFSFRIAFTTKAAQSTSSSTLTGGILCSPAADTTNNNLTIYVGSRYSKATDMKCAIPISSATDSRIRTYDYLLNTKHYFDITRVGTGLAGGKITYLITNANTGATIDSESLSCQSNYKYPIDLTGCLFGLIGYSGSYPPKYFNGVIHLKECYFKAL